MTLDRRTFGRLVLGAGAIAPYAFVRTAVAQPKPGDELVVGVWGGAQERIVKEYLREAAGREIWLQGLLRARRHAGAPGARLCRARAAELRRDLSQHLREPAGGEGRGDAGRRPTPCRSSPTSTMSPSSAATASRFNPCTIVYDKRKAAKPMTSWKDIWNPEWKGRIAWPSYPGAEGTAGLLMAAKVWGGGENNIDVAFEKIKELKPSPRSRAARTSSSRCSTRASPICRSSSAASPANMPRPAIPTSRSPIPSRARPSR